ncbi:ATP-binding cassette domain-containing protein [Aliiglaciecola sp. CAU 1673]|uniref:ATP-binding cassette domain-containing protein n=1 Tax=Aliiglaciecola sp. CAU 1673 TaxID=3032595 RepID=UPI0023DBEE26|nr:ATP-binding cassette domain-containing protein [Aliiglaciecola sp. CAU 1673]MDF2179589.1 ATP-binding cassette domain-containing protein [Aliiglaciecola sp. CAU 1673]
MTPLLSVNNLTYCKKHKPWFGKKEIFRLAPVSFELRSGETMAIIGENGSGKSLLAKLLVGVERPTSGSMQLNGEPLESRQRKQRYRAIRMIFQHSKESLNPARPLGSILDETLQLNTTLSESERKQKIAQTLVQVGMLPEHQYFYRHMLSEGQRQRATVARALILNPQVLVADEPFAALDPSVRSQTVNLLMGLQRDLGLGFIFISHNLGIVRHISDRILVLADGNVVESGKTDVIFNWPKSEYTQRLVYAHQALVSR